MRKIPGNEIPKGMQLSEPESEPQEKKYITLAEANYVADIRRAISELPYNIEIQELVVTEGKNSPPVIQLVMTIT